MNRKVLLIEDNDLNRDMLSRYLLLFGFEVVQAMDANQGIELARQQTPDLILMDMSLPGMDGWEATRLLKNTMETREIPVIALTAHAMTGDRERSLDAGCDDYETKPIDFPKLVNKMEALLKKEIV